MDFDRLAQSMNCTIDATFARGEKGQVRIVPWFKGTYDAGRADDSRDVVTAPGVLFFGEDSIAPAGGGFQVRMAEFDVWMSIDTAPLRAAGAKQGDRVEARGQAFEINRISDDGLGRSKVYMLRAPEE